jgi:DNA-binding phage protein
MVNRKAIRVEASPEYAERARQALREELEHREETQAQVNEVFAQLEATKATIDRLRCERVRQGLSLADIESYTGMTRAAISKLENHHTKNPTLQTLCRYAAAMGMRIDLQVKRAK